MIYVLKYFYYTLLETIIGFFDNVARNYDIIMTRALLILQVVI
jgi:hypothetical protein